MVKPVNDPPPAPDPRVTAAAQTESNIATARKTAELNRINQVTPYGKVTYSQGAPALDRQKWIDENVARERAAWDAANPGGVAPTVYAGDPGGGDNSPQAWTEGTPGAGALFNEADVRKKYEGMPTPEVPGQDQWTQTTELSPEQQRLYDLATKAQTIYGEVGVNQLEAVKGTLSQPDTTDYGAARTSALDNLMKRLNPQFDREQADLTQRLYNQGLTEGSEGWTRAMKDFTDARNNARLDADIRAGDLVGQQIAQTTALRARPLNEVAALLTGQQVQTPQAYAPAAANVANTDVIGAYGQKYAADMAAYQAAQQRNAAGMGGLFGLAGQLGGAALRRYGLPF